MANSDYVGRYGAALRRLTALEGGGLGNLPSAIPQDAPQPGGAFEQMQPPPQNQQGAFETAEGPPMFDKPMTASDMYAQMPPEAKAALVEKVESGGMSVDEKYDALVASGEIKTPPTKPKTKEEKMGYLAEIALRTLSNLSRPGTESISDFADAKLYTDERRGALEMAEQDRVRKHADVRRRESREERLELGREGRAEKRDTAKETRQAAAKGTELEMTQEHTSRENQLNRESEERRAKIRAAQESHRDKRVLMGEDGSMFTLEEDGTAKPITSKKKVKETKAGKRGVKFTVEREVEEQLRGMPKADATGIDKDTIMRAIGDRIKAMKEDGKLTRALKKEGVTDVDGEIARRATQQVMGEYGVVSGKQPSGATTPSAQDGLSPEDRALLQKWGGQ